MSKHFENAFTRALALVVSLSIVFPASTLLFPVNVRAEENRATEDLDREGYKLMFGDKCIDATASSGDALYNDIFYRLPGTNETRKISVCLAKTGYEAEQRRGKAILDSADPVGELRLELDSIYKRVRANLAIGYKNIPNVIYESVTDHCGVIDPYHGLNITTTAFCTWNYINDISILMKQAQKKIKETNDPLSVVTQALMMTYPNIYKRALERCTGKQNDKVCLTKFVDDLAKDKVSASIDGFRKVVALDTWLGTLDKDLSRKNQEVSRQFIRLAKFYGSRHLAKFDGEALVDLGEGSAGSGKKKGKKKTTTGSKKGKSRTLKGSGGEGAAEVVTTKGTGKGQGDGSGDGTKPGKKKTVSKASEKKKKEKGQKAMAKLVKDGGGKKPISAEEFQQLLYDVYDGGQMRGPGGGERPKCPKFIQEAGFCGTGSVYDYRYYKLTSSGDSMLEGAAKSVANNLPFVNLERDYPVAERIDVINAELGSTDFANLYRGVYEVTKSSIQDDLLSFMAELWIEKYIETALIMDPDYLDAHLSKLSETVDGLSCISDSVRAKLKSKQKTLAGNANGIVALLSNDPGSKKAKRGRYQANMAHAAQCADVLYDEVMTLRDKFGLNFKSTRAINEILSEEGIGTNVGYAGAQIFGLLILGPAGALLNYMADNFPLDSHYVEMASAECSWENHRLEPLLVDDEGKVWDPVTDSVPSNVKRNPKQKIGREFKCGPLANRMNGLSEELSSIFAAYPALGASIGEKTLDNAGFKKVIATAGRSSVAKNWLEEDKPGACMAQFLKDPTQPDLGPAEVDENDKIGVNVVLEKKRTSMLDDFRKEMKKLCSEKSGALAQIVSDPTLVDRFRQCKNSRFMGLVNYHNEEPPAISTVGKHTKQYMKELSARSEATYKKYEALSKFTTDDLDKKTCDARKDIGPLLCFMYKDDEIAKRVAEGKAKVMELGFMALDALGSMAPDAFISRSWKQAAFASATGAAVGGALGYGMYNVFNDGSAQSQLETQVAQFQAGIRSDVIELDQNLKEIDKLSKQSGSNMLIQGAATGVLGAHLATGGAKLKWNPGKGARGGWGKLLDRFANGSAVERAAVEGLDLSDRLDFFTESQNLAGHTFAGARKNAARAGDKAMLKALDTLEGELEQILAGAPGKVRDYIKTLPINEQVELLRMYAKEALESGDTFSAALKKNNPADFRRIIERKYGKDVANALSDEEINDIIAQLGRRDVRQQAALPEAKARKAGKSSRTIDADEFRTMGEVDDHFKKGGSDARPVTTDLTPMNDVFANQNNPVKTVKILKSNKDGFDVEVTSADGKTVKESVSYAQLAKDLDVDIELVRNRSPQDVGIMLWARKASPEAKAEVNNALKLPCAVK